MKFFKILKCVFCPKFSCHARYQIGNRTYYSYLGFVRTKCPKKLKNDPFLHYTKQQNDRQTMERLKRLIEHSSDSYDDKNEG